MAVLAELEIFHSRAIAPTRRVALGDSNLPVEPPPGFGGILLGGVVAANIADVDVDLHPDLMRLTVQLEEGQRIPQPRLRNRLQTDRVGLLRSRFRLVGTGEDLGFDFDARCTPAQAVLGAAYAAGRLEPPVRHVVMSSIRRAMRWVGPVGPDLIASLVGLGHTPSAIAAFSDPLAWALNTLGFSPLNGNGAGHNRRNGTRRRGGRSDSPSRGEVQRRFRDLLREAHPDHGGEVDDAAQRIADLSEARRILLAK
jgi:hypothetical protein